MSNGENTFSVIIAGGGVGGLTLASALQRADINYILLEARKEVAPPEGASIAVSANGGRILDQLGVLDDVYSISTPLHRFEGYKDGKNFESNDFLHLNLAR
jgi:2-polyprenyl-6-methoxyphenol hydroxylase-like FAD-dependent oxidoreductase